MLVIGSSTFVIEMYHKMGSEFFGRYVQYHIDPAPPNDKHNPPFTRDQIIRSIRCFLRKRDESEKTCVSFYNECSTDNFLARACKKVTMKKTFVPPSGFPANAMTKEHKCVEVRAGFELGESYTLWVAEGSNESADLRNEYVLSFYHHTC